MPELDTLRGIAVLAVLVVHGFVFTYGYVGYSGLTRHFLHATSLGKVGVNLFFVLSGFLITGILIRSQGDPNFFRNFYARRALRILPAYGLTMLCLLAIGAPWKFVGLSTLFMANSTPLLGIPIFYGPLWSLAVEEHFYLAWPTLIKRVGILGIAIVATVIWLSVPMLLFFSFPSEGLSRYTWFNCDGLALGALIQILVTKVQDRRALKWYALLALLAPCALIFILGPINALYQSSRLGATIQLPLWNILFAGVLLSFLLLGTSSLSRWVTIRPLRFVGHISYGLYLIHLLVFWQVNKVLVIFLPRLSEPNPPLRLIVTGFLIGAVLAGLIAWLSRTYFEECFLLLKSRFKGVSFSPQPISEATPAVSVTGD